jgi:hypothetical protein
MSNDLEELSPPRADPSPPGALESLPSSLVFTEWAAALLRAFLAGEGLQDYRIYFCEDLDLVDIDSHLSALGEADARWTPLGSCAGDAGESVALLTHGSGAAREWTAGALRLASHSIVLARWYWADAENDDELRRLWLCAAPSPAAYVALREKVVRLRRGRGAAHWQVLRGYCTDDTAGPRTRRDMPRDLILTPSVRQRLERDVIRFFSAEVQQLYRELSVPYRRGVLLYGPPGNGKTSLIRFVGASVPQVPAMILRPRHRFDTDDLENAIKRWSRMAPALLVIEDLDWLLQRLNVSLFLNMLDGIDSDLNAGSGGLLLMATTNNPDKLDPAINNRPGRFDVVIEIPPPDRALRREFLARALPRTPMATIDAVASRTDGLSFAHLQEILRLSGLSAIHAQRPQRTDKDLLDAVGSVREAHEQAARGFPERPELPFGLLPLRNKR